MNPTGQFPSSNTLGTRSPGPLIILLLSLLYQVNLVTEQVEHWHCVPWINCIIIMVRALQIELVKLLQCSDFIEKDVSVYGSLGPN